MKDRAQRVLIIAARPDDEAKVFGATIATLIQRGTELIVLSCRSSKKSAATDAAVRQVLGITAHHVLREGSGFPLSSVSVRDLAGDIATAIASLKPDVVVSYAAIASGSAHQTDARLVHEAAALATELAGVPFYTESSIPVDRGVEVTSATAIAFKRRAVELYTGEIPVGDSALTATEYLRRLRRRDLVMGERSRVERVVLALVATALGAIVGLVLTAVHQSAMTLFGARVPSGLIAALVLTTALILGLRLIYDTRVAAGFASLGVLLMSGLLAAVMPGGTVLIPANLTGYVWTFAPVLIVLVVVGWPRVNRQPSIVTRDTIEEKSLVEGADNS